jgi:hypothetical protein
MRAKTVAFLLTVLVSAAVFAAGLLRGEDVKALINGALL